MILPCDFKSNSDCPNVALIGKESYDKFICDIQEHIDETDRPAKEKADATLEAISEIHKNILSVRRI